MAKLFPITILTPEGVVYQSEVLEVIARTKAGEIGILARHTPLLSILNPGNIVVKKEGYKRSIRATGGIIEVRKTGEVVVLADEVTEPEEQL